MVSGSLALLYFLLSFHGGRQGSGPDRGRSPVEWGDFPFVHSSVRPSVDSPLWAIHPGLSPSQPSLRLQAWLAGPQAWLDGPEGGGRTDERMNGRTENLPILQDFVPYRGRCPASPHEN